MRKKWIYRVMVLAVLTVGITACGSKEEDVIIQEQTLAETEQTEETVPEPEISPQEPRDLEETDESVREQGMLMLQNLELEDYLDESINLITTEEWFRAMMDGADGGSRNYYKKQDGETVLTIETGYDEAGESYARVCYFGERVRVLQRKGNAVQLLTTQVEDGRYEGDYEVWTCDGETGYIYQETGFFAEGVLTGEYTLKVHEGEEPSEVFSLWSNREGMKYTTYTGTYEEQQELSVDEWFWWEHETEGLVKEEEQPAAQKPASKPAAQEPASEEPKQEPEQPAAEQQPAQQQPAQQPSAGQQEPVQPSEEIQQPAEDSGENDVDVEWTPDIL